MKDDTRNEGLIPCQRNTTTRNIQFNFTSNRRQYEKYHHLKYNTGTQIEALEIKHMNIH